MDENKKSDAQPISHPFPPRTLQIGEKSYNTSQAAKIIGVDRKTVEPLIIGVRKGFSSKTA